MTTKSIVLIIAAAATVHCDSLKRAQKNYGYQQQTRTADDLTRAIELPPSSGLVNQNSFHTVRGTVQTRFSQVYSGVLIWGSVVTAEFDRQGSFTGQLKGEYAGSITKASMSASLPTNAALSALANQFLRPNSKSAGPGNSNGANGDSNGANGNSNGANSNGANGSSNGANGNSNGANENLNGANENTNGATQQPTYSNVQKSLIWYPDSTTNSLRLSYYVRFALNADTSAEPIIPCGIIDAMTGNVLLSWNDAAFLAPYLMPGVGGNMGRWGRMMYTDVPVTKLSDGVSCQYSTSRVQVQNNMGSFSTSGNFIPATRVCSQATNNTSDAINGGYSALNDVARNADIVVSMYQTYLGFNGTTGTLPQCARVHYGINYDNAFWDGTAINIGDGNTLFYPITSLDVVSHELSHGFTQSYSALALTDQSGGISEAFSDAAGEAAEYFATGSNDFIIASQIMKNATGLRYMCNPILDNRSIDNIANYIPFMSVHASSGLYNKPFCLLAKTPGWGVPAAFQVYAFANAVYWSQSTTFRSGVCGIQFAASDLGQNPADVTNAFKAVGLACG